jgi:hypothetical protein
METTTVEETLSQIDPSQRVLLLSHCQRPSQTCPGKFNKQGLQCPPDCKEECNLARMKNAALKLGYLGVCIAAGGAQALRFVKDNNPRGIVAIACHKELDEGIAAVKELSDSDTSKYPPIVIVPLLRDGCVDTEVDMEQAMKAISLGCSLDGPKPTVKEKP